MRRLYIKVIITLVLAILLVGCAGSGGGGQAAQDKSLFSEWVLESDPNFVFDLRTVKFNQVGPITFYFQDGARCRCDLNVTGDEGAGDYSLASCGYVGGGGGNPGCASLDVVGTYAKSAKRLTLCDSGSCDSFK